MYRVFIFLFFFCSYGFSQSDSTKSKDLEEVVISAKKFESNKIESLQQINSINAKKIISANTSNMAHLLEQKGNVFIQRSQGGGGSPVIRGFEASSVLLVLDGIRVNNAIFRAGHLQNILRIDQNALSSVEILLGPSSVQYGSDALGGAILMYTKDASLNTKSFNSLVRYSTNAEKTFHTDFNLGNNRFASFSSLSMTQIANLRMGKRFKKGYEGFGLRNKLVSNNPDNNEDQIILNPDPYLQNPSGYEQLNIVQKFKYETKNVSHKLNLQYSTTGNVQRYDRLTDTLENGKQRFAEWYYGPEKHSLIAYQASLKSKTKLYETGFVSVAYQSFNESRNTRAFNSLFLNKQNERLNAINFNIDLKKQINNHEIIYGAEIIENKVKSTAEALNIKTNQISNAASRYPDAGGITQNASAFVNINTTYGKKITMVYSLRFITNNLEATFKDKTFFPFPFDAIKQNNNSVTYNLGLNFKPVFNQKIAAFISKGYRTPNIDDLAKVYESTSGRLVVPNPDIKPENSLHYEINYDMLNSKKLNLELAIFYTAFQNVINLSNFTLNGQSKILYRNVESEVFAQQNRGNASIKGISAGLKSAFGKNFEFSTYYNIIEGKLADGSFLDRIPPSYGKSSIYLNNKNIQLEIYAIYNAAKSKNKYSKSGEDNPQYATKDGSLYWATINLKSNFKVLNKLSIQSGIENIFDVNYRQFASGISGAGRNFIISGRFGI